MSARTIHPFPARMAPEIALAAMAATDSLDVLDPMCGSGTVLREAVRQGHSATGLDIDPLAVLMATVATTPIDTDALKRSSKRVLKRLPAQAPISFDAETNEFASFWFGPVQRRDLQALARSIQTVGSRPLRHALQVALTRTIVTKSPRASLAADTAHSRPHKVIEKSDYNVLEGFERSVQGLAKLLDARELNGVATVHQGDARHWLRRRSTSFDLIMTSPPYLNALDYMRGHRLALIWLGYSIQECREIRSNSIGAERGADGHVPATVLGAVQTLLANAPNPEGIPFRVVHRYALDLYEFAEQMRGALKPDGRLICVIGNSVVRGNIIPNDELLSVAIEAAGLQIVNRWTRELPPHKRYLPMHTSSIDQRISKRMATEVILEASNSEITGPARP